MKGEVKKTILILDDDKPFLHGLQNMLSSNSSLEVVAIDKSEQLMPLLAQREFAVLLLDWIMPGLGGDDLLPLVVEMYPDLPVIVMTAIDDYQHIVGCIKQGAFDYIPKSTNPNRFLSSIEKACEFYEIKSQNRRLKSFLLGDTLLAPEVFADILTVHPRMQALFKLIETMSVSSHPVMITGETGVGKELFARAIHVASGVGGEFVALNVAGLDDHMFTDTLFGHRKGAFTGAHETRDGLIAKAQGGTLFLDEIGDLASESQVKLLRLLQEREYYRLGSDAIIKSDARIITASNSDFDTMLNTGRFRRDLYHRLRSHHVHIPPLRERREDIAMLVDHYLHSSAAALGRPAPSISREALAALKAFDYPGNVRELVHMIHHAVACNSGGILTLDDFPGITVPAQPERQEFQIFKEKHFRIHALFPQFPSLDTVEKLVIDEALRLTDGNKSLAADLLGIARSTLHRKLDLNGGSNCYNS